MNHAQEKRSRVLLPKDSLWHPCSIFHICSFSQGQLNTERLNLSRYELNKSQVVTERQAAKDKKALPQRSACYFCNCWNRKWKFHQDLVCPQRCKVKLPILSELSKSQVVTERQAAKEEKAPICIAARYLGNCKQTFGSHFWNKSCDHKPIVSQILFLIQVLFSWLERKALSCLTALYPGTSGGIPPPANRHLNATIRNIHSMWT